MLIEINLQFITKCILFTVEKYSLLGVRKDYWNFISDCIPKDDGVRVVHAIPQV